MEEIIVLDASAALEIVLVRERAPGLSALLEQAEKVLAPELFLLETANAMGKYVIHEGLSLAVAQERLDDVSLLITDWIPAIALNQEAFIIGVKYRISIYDACYLFIAKHFDALLLSLDKKLIRIAIEMGLSAKS